MTHEPHAQWCQRKFMPRHSDEARRLCDTWNLHRVADPHGSVGKWFAARLDNGTSDNVLYDTKLECVRHQRHNERYYAFIRVVPSTMIPCEAEVIIRTNRRLYANGMRMADPDHRHGGLDVVKRLTAEDMQAFAMGRVTNLRMPTGGD